MVSRLTILALLAVVLSACETAGNCAGWGEIRPSRQDRLTDGTATQILEHNEFGRKQGCWKR